MPKFTKISQFVGFSAMFTDGHTDTATHRQTKNVIKHFLDNPNIFSKDTYTHGLIRTCQYHGQCHADSPCQLATVGHELARPGCGWASCVETEAWPYLYNPSALSCRCQSLCQSECQDGMCE